MTGCSRYISFWIKAFPYHSTSHCGLAHSWLHYIFAYGVNAQFVLLQLVALSFRVRNTKWLGGYLIADGLFNWLDVRRVDAFPYLHFIYMRI